jgi:protein-tyrosine-phosphatase
MKEDKNQQKKPSILFVCTAGGARGCFAAEFAAEWSGESACAMAVSRLFEEVGLPAHQQSPKTVFQRYSAGESFDFIVTMCGESRVDVCASFRKTVHTIYGNAAVVDWEVPDFRGIQATGESWLAEARMIRDEIRSLTKDFITSVISTDGLG